jgi:micrococcal nuclease
MNLKDVIDEAAELLASGKSSSKEAADQASVRAYWEVGRILAAHLEETGWRANYGERVVARLSEVAGIRTRQVYEYIDFGRKFPNVPSRAQLTSPFAKAMARQGSHYRRLLSVETVPRRQYYVREAVRHGWSVKVLETAIEKDVYSKDREAEVAGDGQQLKAYRGELYAYKVVDSGADDDRVGVDLGFGIVRSVWWGIEEKRPKKGSIVRSERGSRGAGGRGGESKPRGGRSRHGEYGLSVVDGRAVRGYTYKAVVTDIVDEDTIWVDLDHGFHTRSWRKLRFRGIDAPEMWTRAGQVAKGFVEERLGGVEFVVVRTRRPDKYGRYLADVYYGGVGETDATVVAREGAYLNGEMVREGMAVGV